MAASRRHDNHTVFNHRVDPFPSLLGKVARSAGWGVVGCCGAKRLARSFPRTCSPSALLSTPHPSPSATPSPASRRRGLPGGGLHLWIAHGASRLAMTTLTRARHDCLRQRPLSLSAGCGDAFARQPGGPVGSEEQRHARDVVGLAEASQSIGAPIAFAVSRVRPNTPKPSVSVMPGAMALTRILRSPSSLPKPW